VTPERVYQQLEELLARLGVPVRAEAFDPRMFGDLSSKGGLCRLHGRTVVVVDSTAPLVERVTILAAAAASLDTESVYVLPAIRDVIDNQRLRPEGTERRPPTLRLICPKEAPDAKPGRKG